MMVRDGVSDLQKHTKRAILLVKQYKGDRLYVNLGASATRRRLKGRGLGVKKVETAGSNQAVIIHTATGQHRRELEALFQDVARPPDSAKPPEHDDDPPADEDAR